MIELKQPLSKMAIIFFLQHLSITYMYCSKITSLNNVREDKRNRVTGDLLQEIFKNVGCFGTRKSNNTGL